MRIAVLILCLGLSSCFNVVELSDRVHAHWRAQTQGDAVAFVSNLASGFSQTINGEVDTTPWTDGKYVQSLFDKLSFSTFIPATPISLASPNSVLVVVEWQINFTHTLDILDMGEWQQLYTFNDDGKITAISSICDGANVQRYIDLTSEQMVDYKPTFDTLVGAFNTKNVKGVLNAFVPEDELYWRRNGHNDSFTWVKPRFLGFLFQQTLSLKLDSFVSSVPRTSFAVMTWTHTARDGKVTVFPDSWFITWSPENKISHVRSVTSGQETILYAHLMSAVTEALTPQKKNELKVMYQSGDYSTEKLRQHLDL